MGLSLPDLQNKPAQVLVADHVAEALADQAGLGEGAELDPDGEASLELGDEIAGPGAAEGPRGDEEDVLGVHRAVPGMDGRALEDGQQVPLHTLTADVGAVLAAAVVAGDLVHLVDEDDAAVL